MMVVHQNRLRHTMVAIGVNLTTRATRVTPAAELLTMATTSMVNMASTATVMENRAHQLNRPTKARLANPN